MKPGPSAHRLCLTGARPQMVGFISQHGSGEAPGAKTGGSRDSETGGMGRYFEDSAMATLRAHKSENAALG